MMIDNLDVKKRLNLIESQETVENNHKVIFEKVQLQIKAEIDNIDATIKQLDEKIDELFNKQNENKKGASNHEKKQCKYDRFCRQRDECDYFHTLEICQLC